MVSPVLPQHSCTLYIASLTPTQLLCLRLDAAPFRESYFAALDLWNSLYLLQLHCICLVLLCYDCLVTSSPSILKDYSAKVKTRVCSPLCSQILDLFIWSVIIYWKPMKYPAVFGALELKTYCCSVAQLCLTLCNSMDCSMPGFPVLYHFLELVQIHVHWVSDAIQPSHSLSSPSPPVFNLS